MGKRLLIGMAVLSLVSVARAQSDAVNKINQTLHGKNVTIRGFYQGDRLVYGATGALVSRAKPGIWTLDGELLFKKAKLNRNALQITGQRLAVYFPNHNAERHYQKLGAAEIEVDFDHAPSFDDLNHAISKIFISGSGSDTLANAVPAYWQPFLNGTSTSGLTSQGGSDLIDAAPFSGGSYGGPRPISKTDPEYSDAARMHRYSGSCTLWATVTAAGNVVDPRIVRALGFGLDEQAVKSLLQWKFNPALQNGRPLPMRVSVDVQFHLF